MTVWYMMSRRDSLQDGGVEALRGEGVNRLGRIFKALTITPGTESSTTILKLGQGLRRSEFRIPPRTAGLLYTAKGPAVRADFELRVRLDLLSGSSEGLLFHTEPSTVFVDEPAVLPENVSSVPRPPYYPRYGALSPMQRGVYLNWLQDPTGPIDPGYVFLYYYGLERQLLLGDFQNALDEIVMLRHYHPNPSFQSYSMTALLTACVVRNRPDSTKEILRSLADGVPSNVLLLVAARLGLALPADTVAGIALLLRERVNVRYLKSNPALYKESLAAALVSRYGAVTLPLGWVPAVDMLPKKRQLAFANTSFPDNVRFPFLPNIVDSKVFVETMGSLFEEVHTLVKEHLAADRKLARAIEKHHILPSPPGKHASPQDEGNMAQHEEQCGRQAHHRQTGAETVPARVLPLNTSFSTTWDADVWKAIDASRAQRHSLSESLWRTDDAQRQGLALIEKASREGIPFDKIKADLQALVIENDPASMQYNVRLLWATELRRNRFVAEQSIWKSLGVIKQVRLYRSADADETCELCGHAIGGHAGDERIVPLDSEMPPFHLGCKCNARPVEPTAEEMKAYLNKKYGKT